MNLSGLEGREGLFPNELSGEQRQRVAIAKALIMEPKVILVDEPMGNLDRHRGREVLDIRSRLHREEQMTIVMVTHDLSVASFAERILLYKDDRMESGDPAGEGGMAHVLEDFLAKLQNMKLIVIFSLCWGSLFVWPLFLL